MLRFHRAATILCLAAFAVASASAQQTPPPVSLTLKRALELALQNSKDIKIARIQASVADRAAMIGKGRFSAQSVCWLRAGYTTAFRKRRAAERRHFQRYLHGTGFHLPLRGRRRSNKSRLKRKKFCWKTREIP